MKLESLVIVNQHVTVNDLSNFAHTAHHARRVVPARNLLSRIISIFCKNSVKEYVAKVLVGGTLPRGAEANAITYVLCD